MVARERKREMKKKKDRLNQFTLVSSFCWANALKSSEDSLFFSSKARIAVNKSKWRIQLGCGGRWMLWWGGIYAMNIEQRLTSNFFFFFFHFQIDILVGCISDLHTRGGLSSMSNHQPRSISREKDRLVFFLFIDNFLNQIQWNKLLLWSPYPPIAGKENDYPSNLSLFSWI